MRRFFVFSLFFFIFVPNTLAIENPKAVANNKFGIHIVDENDLEKASELVNSSGGDWGYITVVIREDERSFGRWQETFNKMRRMHLIPIIRIATKQTPDGWEKPKSEEINNWIAFLNSLNWVVKNRYVVIGNEPNQAHEWGGEISPDEYGIYLKEFSKRLKNVSNDFYILPAGFDASAPNSKATMTEEKFLTEMTRLHPDFFSHIDGWTSHSYPNPNKSLDNQFGKATARTYLWELDLLKRLGVQKDFDVFITETGWQHNGKGELPNIAQNYQDAFDMIWQDPKIVAVTPFLLSYKAYPFLQFSWLDPSGAPYGFYYDVQKIPKLKGEPNQITDGVIVGNVSFPLVQSGHGIYGLIIVENKGQSIWTDKEVSLNEGEIFPYQDIEPFDRRILFFKIKAPDLPGQVSNKLQLTRNGVPFGNSNDIYTRVFQFVSPLQFFRPIW